MGFKQATQSEYVMYDLVFSSKREYSNAKLINEKLETLYSSTRENEEELNSLLDKVEELVNRFDEGTKLRIGEGNFNQHFVGIVKFLYEANDIVMNIENELSKQMPEYIKKRIISISAKLMYYCVLVEF